MGRKEKIIVGLDIGSTKVSTLIAVPRESGLDAIGFGDHHEDAARDRPAIERRWI